MLWLAERLSQIPGVVAVALGGSRAQGTERTNSDWDFGLYYRGTLDPEDIRALGYDGIIVAPGEWAYPMNGGAWLTVDRQKVDLLYRDLDDVEHWIAESDAGRWNLYRMPSYLAGMASYVLVGELALARVLAGDLPRPVFPERLRDSAPNRWRWEAGFALDAADVHADRGEVAACVGKLAFAIIAEAQARLASLGEWALNEKGIVDRAGLVPAEELILQGGRQADLPRL